MNLDGAVKTKGMQSFRNWRTTESRKRKYDEYYFKAVMHRVNTLDELVTRTASLEASEARMKDGFQMEQMISGKKLIYEHSFPIVMKKVIKALRGYNWCMIGGRSVEVWANPPQTPDVDVLVQFTARDAKHVLAAMGDEGFVLDKKFIDRDSAPMFFFHDSEEAAEVDLIGAFEDVHGWAVERSVKKMVGGIKIPVAQPEDIVILKAYAAVSPRREKREHDEAAIMALNEELDLDTDYIEIVLSQALADTTDERNLLAKLGVLE